MGLEVPQTARALMLQEEKFEVYYQQLSHALEVSFAKPVPEWSVVAELHFLAQASRSMQVSWVCSSGGETYVRLILLW